MFDNKIIDDNFNTNNVIVDIIVLGCSLPGMVTAHKLRKTFGDTMDIVILDLVNKPKSSKEYDEVDKDEFGGYDRTARDVADNLTKYYLTAFAELLNIVIPKAITEPENLKSNLSKIFEYENGNETYHANLYEFTYLNVFEKFELNQYQESLDVIMKDLFQANKVCDFPERKKIMCFDHKNMEQHICSSLLFPKPRNIMRTTVRLACGVSPDKVSVLFFLYQCYRTGSVANNLDGNNTKLREKLFGYFKEHLSNRLHQNISNITLPSKPIKEITLYNYDKVMLKTRQGHTNYVCNHLAMALKPDELQNIQFESALLSESEKSVITSMTKGKSKKFWIQYREKFWRKTGYSGDIFSIRGPILWMTERPNLPHAVRDICPLLIGYLNTGETENSEEAVKQQLVSLYGEEAARPVRYIESEIDDVYVPRCGNFIALRRLHDSSDHRLEWGSLDVFAEGDTASALEAGHKAYLHLLAFLRPQAQTYEDLEMSNWPTFFNDTNPLRRWFSRVNIASSTRLVMYAMAAYVGYRVLRHLKA